MAGEVLGNPRHGGHWAPLQGRRFPAAHPLQLGMLQPDGLASPESTDLTSVSPSVLQMDATHPVVAAGRAQKVAKALSLLPAKHGCCAQHEHALGHSENTHELFSFSLSPMGRQAQRG